MHHPSPIFADLGQLDASSLPVLNTLILLVGIGIAIWGVFKRGPQTPALPQPLTVKAETQLVSKDDFRHLARRVDMLEKSLADLPEKISHTGELRAERIHERIDGLTKATAHIEGVIDQMQRDLKQGLQSIKRHS